MQDLNSNDQKNYNELESSKVSPPSGGGDLEGAVIIRRGIKADCKRLMELIHQLAVYEKAPEEMTVTQEHFEESGFGGKPVWWAFVAEVNGKVEGFALYYIRYSTWKGQRMYLEDFLVN